MSKPSKTKPKYPNEAHFQHVWELLKFAIDKIHANEASNLSFEELYRSSYQMVLHKRGDVLYNNVSNVLTEHLEKRAVHISRFTSDFLPQLQKSWEAHCIAMQMVRDILMYLDRTYVQQQKLPSIYEVGLQLFRDVVFQSSKYPIKQRTTDSLLGMIASEREGEVLDKRLMKSITEMLIIIGMETTDVYVQDFEKVFLESSLEFYSRESELFLAENDSSVYLKKVEGRIREEEERVESYLDSQTKEKILKIVEKELIQNQMKKVLEMDGTGLIPMLEHCRIDDLSRMYRLFGLVEEGHASMKKILIDFVFTSGQKINNDPSVVPDSVSWVQQVISLKDKFDLILEKSFSKDKSFQTAINDGFKKFVRMNPKAPEYVSLFIDDKLKKGIKGLTEDEVDSILDKSLVLFRFLEEKDVFEKYYKNHLAKRLLYRRSISDDAERNMISKLKSECGHQFTSKLEGMFTDLRISEDLMTGFRHFQEKKAENKTENKTEPKNPPIELSVTVLTMNNWPLPSNSPKCNFPEEITKTCEVFQEFYFARFTGRRLTWQKNMGQADLKARFSKRVHELGVTTFSMAILLLFNQADSLSFKEISSSLGIEEPELKKNLQALSCGKYKILIKASKGREVEDDDQFTFNANFSAPLTKLKIQMIANKPESEQESQETQEKVEEDRKLQVEACIVRVMKSRRNMEHNNLLAEVTKQLSSRFQPNPNQIKKRIENLIEREFLERSSSDHRMYNYVA